MSKRHRRYTEDELAFLREFIPGRGWREVADEFEARFGVALTHDRVRYLRKRLGVYSGFGRGGWPKGKTWDEQGISPEGQERSRATTFKVGNVPKKGRRYKVGDERVGRGGYVWVKVCESYLDPRARYHEQKGNRCWRLKHHAVWEREHGVPLPRGYDVVFANGDKTDFEPGNLVAMPHATLMTINTHGMQYYDAESLRACVTMAGIIMALKRKKRGGKEAAADA